MDPKQFEAIRAPKDFLEQPFNACNQVNGRVPPWEHLPLHHLEEELRRRGLPYEGTRYDLVLRLLNHNTWICQKKGSLEIYKKKKDLCQKQSLETVVPFKHFPKFSPEIRLMIWRHSLPGPRVLHAHQLCQVNGIIFLNKENLDNPVALSTCCESRAVALERYSLAFGTSYFYADLSGGDTLFLDDDWCGDAAESSTGMLQWQFELQRAGARSVVLSPSVVAGMAKITNLAISIDIWHRYEYAEGFSHSIHALLKMFSSLKQLQLVANQQGDVYGTPGYKILSDRISDRSLLSWASHAKKMIIKSNWTEQEIKRGIPEVSIVSVNAVSHIPNYDSEAEYGQPFYDPKIISEANSVPKTSEPCTCYLCNARKVAKLLKDAIGH